MDQFTKTQYEGDFDDKDLATHVVAGIEYGADYVVSFTTFIENGETADDVKAKLSAISGDASIDIRASSLFVCLFGNFMNARHMSFANSVGL
jgi:hypothetical protein